MRRARLSPALGLIVGAGIFLSACGGDDSEEQTIAIPTDTQVEALSKSDFIDAADPICEEANAAIEQFAAAGQGVTEADEIADLRQGVIRELQELGPPDEDRGTLDNFLTGMENQVEAGEKIALANERGTDSAEFEAELDAAQAETLAAAEEYGFEVCGQELGASAAPGTTPAAPTGPTAPAAPVTPAPAAPDAGGGVGGTDGTDGGGTDGGTGDTGDSDGDGGGVSPGGGGIGPG